jgi:hypothetical protein
MNDQELRAMIRESIARHVGASAAALPPLDLPDPAAAFGAHSSHRRLPVARGSDDDGACIIEPEVRCTHCGFCISYGH